MAIFNSKLLVYQRVDFIWTFQYPECLIYVGVAMHGFVLLFWKRTHIAFHGLSSDPVGILGDMGTPSLEKQYFIFIFWISFHAMVKRLLILP